MASYRLYEYISNYCDLTKVGYWNNNSNCNSEWKGFILKINKDVLTELDCNLVSLGIGYLLTRPHLTGKCGTRPFYGGSGRRGRSAHAPGISPKTPTAPVGIPLIRGRLRRRGDEPNLSEGSESLGGRPPEADGKNPRHRDTLGQIRVPTARPAKVLPSTWGGPVRNQFVTKMIWTGSR